MSLRPGVWTAFHLCRGGGFRLPYGDHMGSGDLLGLESMVPAAPKGTTLDKDSRAGDAWIGFLPRSNLPGGAGEKTACKGH